MARVAFYTLGCKVNQYETEGVLEMFKQKGYSIVDFNRFADVYVINTCTVTNLSDRKSRQMISKAKSINNNSVIVVMGCYAQVSPEDVGRIEGVSLIIGTKDRHKVVDLVEEFLKNKQQTNIVNDILRHKDYEDLNIISFENRTRGFIKIQEGCAEFCSYCIIPYARGPVRSRSMESIIKEVNTLADNGFKEVVLTGIHVSSYGKDLDNIELINVIKEISEIEGIKRIRLGSLEPMHTTNDFIKELIRYEKVCPHFHISLQSGSDETLKRMHRKYNSSKYKEIIDTIRKYYKDVSITTDIMVGFPGETKEEFEDSLIFAKEINFSKIHVFKYSPRKGTPAAKYPDQIDPRVKEERSKRMIELSNKCENEFLKKHIGREVDVLFEQVYKKDKHYIEGLTGNYINVVAEGDSSLIGELKRVNIKDINGEVLYGKIKGD